MLNNYLRLGKRFIAGLLRHSKEIIAITCQWVNSYKRLIPGLYFLEDREPFSFG
jgi:glutamine synthetase